MLFAVDSVPAILAITTDTFVVFAANAFALMGLRALFFLVAGLVQRFAYLQTGLGILLIAIAGKLAYGELSGEKIPTVVTLDLDRRGPRRLDPRLAAQGAARRLPTQPQEG